MCVSELTAPGEGYKGPEHRSTWYGMTVLVTESLQKSQTRLVSNVLSAMLVYRVQRKTCELTK